MVFAESALISPTTDTPRETAGSRTGSQNATDRGVSNVIRPHPTIAPSFSGSQQTISGLDWCAYNANADH